MKILLIKPSSLGDVVQALPVLSNLRRHYPEAQIDWLVFKPYGDLLEEHPDIDHVLSIRKPSFEWGSWKDNIAPLRLWFKENSYDMAIDLQGLFRSGLLTFFSKAKRKIGLASAREGASCFYNEVVQDTAIHAATRYLQVLDHLKIPYDPLLFGLAPTADLPGALSPSEIYYVFHPYTRWKTKLWPWRNYQGLAHQLAPHRCVLIGNGPWFPCEGDNIVDLRNQLNLKSTMKVLSHAKAVIGTDSGPGHLAAALGVSTVTLFGATNPKKTSPVGKNTIFLQGKVSCAPCMSRVCRNQVEMACMKEISISNITHYLKLI